MDRLKELRELVNVERNVGILSNAGYLLALYDARVVESDATITILKELVAAEVKRREAAETVLLAIERRFLYPVATGSLDDVLLRRAYHEWEQAKTTDPKQVL